MHFVLTVQWLCKEISWQKFSRSQTRPRVEIAYAGIKQKGYDIALNFDVVKL